LKTRGEKSIEALTWASVVMWLGFSLIMHLLDYAWLVLMVLGIILLSSAIYQRSRGWHTSLMIWIGGVWMAIFSVIEVTNEILTALSTDGRGLEIDLLVYLGIALISMGLAVVLRHLQPPNLAQSGAPQRAARDSQEPAAPVVPRRVAEDYSSGYFPPDGRVQNLRSDTERQGASPSRARAIAEQSTASPRARPVSSGADQSWTQSASVPPRATRRRARPAQPSAETPANMEARVEDIIRRSRERRGGASGGDLPY